MSRLRDIQVICQKAKAASRKLALLPAKTKNKALNSMGKALLDDAGFILKENAKDVDSARRDALSGALIDRLSLSGARIRAMADSIFFVSKLPDPVGEILETRKRPNGLEIKKVRVPIGVILMIYEARPNVTSDCIALCLKSGNSVILRGSSSSLSSNLAIFKALNRAAVKHGIPDGAITMIDHTGRKAVTELLTQSTLIDLVMPRGGESLIRYVRESSMVPVIAHYKGVCHTYVDKAADLKMAEDICFNAKVQRPGVCNAMETMLVHRSVAERFLPPMIRRFVEAGVEIRGCKDTKRITGVSTLATEEDWCTEYLAPILSVKVVRNAGEAIAHIMKYGSYHSDAIVTKDRRTAAKFLREVDSACVYVNASTRFTDGGEFGKGAEIGISTDKIHARGPMGLEELTSYKYEIFGNGQVRE